MPTTLDNLCRSLERRIKATQPDAIRDLENVLVSTRTEQSKVYGQITRLALLCGTNKLNECSKKIL